jgi:hypothetical protein
MRRLPNAEKGKDIATIRRLQRGEPSSFVAGATSEPKWSTAKEPANSRPANRYTGNKDNFNSKPERLQPNESAAAKSASTAGNQSESSRNHAIPEGARTQIRLLPPKRWSVSPFDGYFYG